MLKVKFIIFLDSTSILNKWFLGNFQYGGFFPRLFRQDGGRVKSPNPGDSIESKFPPWGRNSRSNSPG